MEGNESANKSGSVASNEESRTMATDHYMSDLHESMKSLHEKFDGLSGQYANLNNDVHGRDGIDSRICLVEAEVGDITYNNAENNGKFEKNHRRN